MPYVIPFEIGDEVTLKTEEYSWGGFPQTDGDKLFGAIGRVERVDHPSGIASVLWPPEITHDTKLRHVDAWCLESPSEPVTDKEIAETFGLIGMPVQQEKPSAGHLKSLYRIVQEGDWAQERLVYHLGEDWRTSFEEE